MLGETWTRGVVQATVGIVLAGTLLAGCGDDGDGADVSPWASGSSSSAKSPLAHAGTATTEPSSSPPVGACSPPTTDVTYSAGAALLTVANGPQAGDYELTIDADRPEDNAYVTSLGEQLIGNWRGGGLESDLPALEVRILGEGDVCQGAPIVRIYLPFLAYEDNDSVACTANLDMLSSTAAAGRFECTSMSRTFGSNDPDTLDASGTFRLGS